MIIYRHNNNEVMIMPKIMPISELRNNFTEVSRIAHETAEPIFLTKNGFGDMVVMSIESFEKKQMEHTINIKLKEAELETLKTDLRFDFDEVSKEMRGKLVEKLQNKNASISED